MQLQPVRFNGYYMISGWNKQGVEDEARKVLEGAKIALNTGTYLDSTHKAAGNDLYATNIITDDSIGEVLKFFGIKLRLNMKNEATIKRTDARIEKAIRPFKHFGNALELFNQIAVACAQRKDAHMIHAAGDRPDHLKEKISRLMENVSQDFEVQHGQPVIANTRIPVSVILGSLAGGMSYEEVIKDYGVTVEQIRACLAYAVDLISTESIFSTQNK